MLRISRRSVPVATHKVSNGILPPAGDFLVGPERAYIMVYHRAKIASLSPVESVHSRPLYYSIWLSGHLQPATCIWTLRDKLTAGGPCMEILYLIHKASHHWCLYYVKPLLVENEWWPENWRTEKGMWACGECGVM